ncbi:ABC transporter substrate-binding protein, partial [Streptomyces sp. NPDC056982]|uniref:ABC transporter substrate-binding protein n=1 Tax=Streptomyces sp. NPDC056982 TaxID=3345986 RepID=UPI0036D25A42
MTSNLRDKLMLKPVLSALMISAALSSPLHAAEKLTLMLDWYINPDHAPIMVAQQTDAFKAEGLEVTIVPPSDP